MQHPDISTEGKRQRYQPKIDEMQALNSGFYVGDWLIEPLKGRFSQAGQSRRVEPKVMDVLVCLAAEAGVVVRRDDLLECVWGDVVVSEEVLTRCISELRSALGDTNKTRSYIQTLPKRGYRLLKPVRPLELAADESNPTMAPDQASPTSKQEAAAAPPASSPSFWLAGGILGLVLSLAALFILLLNQPKVPLAEPVAAAPQAATGAAAPPLASDNTAADTTTQTVAVLPFVNLSGDEETDYFANGLTADIRNTLIRVATEQMRVVARTSSEAFRGRAIDIRSIGAQLGAQLIVEGTVRISNDRVRVTAQLTNTGDGFPIWAERFEHDLEDRLLIQSTIAERIAEQFAPNLALNQDSPDFAANLKSYDYYLLGRHHWNRRTPEALELADSYFRRALELEPNYAAALSGLADALLLKEDYGGSNPDNAVELAQSLIDQALALRPDLGEANASAGLIAKIQGDFDKAESFYRRAVELKPTYSMGRMWLGNLLLDRSEAYEAHEHFESALQSDPLNPAVRQNYLRALSLMGRYEEATQRAKDYFSETPTDYLLKMWMYIMLDAGRYDDLLSFAVRQSFSSDYADYGTEIVIKALIFLQRFDDAKTLYEQLAPRLDSASQSRILAQLATALRDSRELREAALMLENHSDFRDPKSECQQYLTHYWRGVAAHIDGNFDAAAKSFELALPKDNTGNCLKNPALKAQFRAYYIASLHRIGERDRARSLTERAQTELNAAVTRGRQGLDMAFAKLSLQVASDQLDQARIEITTMQEQNWQYYAKLAHTPLFDAYHEDLHPSIGDNAQQFALMQSECRDIGMAKFGL